MLPTSDRARLVQLFLHADQERAQQTRMAGCPHCDAVVHAGHYRRKLYGLESWPEAASEARALSRRYSWCCSNRECRRRATPPSVTFLGLRRYAHVVVLLLTWMTRDAGPSIARSLQDSVRVDRRTLGRWREWWRSTFPQTRRWQSIRARFAVPIDAGLLPGSLLAQLSPESDTATHAYFALMAAELARDQPWRGS